MWDYLRGWLATEQRQKKHIPWRREGSSLELLTTGSPHNRVRGAGEAEGGDQRKERKKT